MVWSPAGTRLAYYDNGGISVIDADGTNKRPIIENDVGSGSEFGWSPDGTKVAFITANDLWVIKADGTNRTRLFSLDSEYYHYVERPMWSPDGTMLAYLASHRIEDEELWVIDADGTNRKKIVGNVDNFYDAVWSPDSTRITYAEYGGLWAISTSGTNPTKLDNLGDNPAWSPDGTKIVYNNRNHYGIWVIERARSQQDDALTERLGAYMVGRWKSNRLRHTRWNELCALGYEL